MKQVIRWTLLSFCGWLGAVQSIQLTRTACQTLHIIYNSQLDIKCNSDEIVYVNRVTLNNLREDLGKTVNNNSECQKTSASACFRSMPSDIHWNNTFYRKISKICNGNHNCSLTYRDLNFYVTKFEDQFVCNSNQNRFLTRIGCNFECFPSKDQVFVGENIFETRNGSLYLTKNESGQCLFSGSIKSARILEQTDISFTVSDRKSPLCTEILKNGSFNYNEDMSCLRDVDMFLLDIQTTNTLSGKLWIEFKGVSLRLDCRNNIQVPPVVHLEENGYSNSELIGGSTILPLIIGVVAGLLLLLALILILIVLKRRTAQTIKAEAKHTTINVTTTLEDQDCTYYSNDAGKSRNNANDLQGTQYSFDDTYYNTVETGCNNAEINIKKKTSETGIYNGEQNVKKERDDTEKSRKESHHSKNVIPRSSKTAGSKPNTIIGEVTGDVYAEVCKTDGFEESRQEPRDTPRPGKTAGSKTNTIIGEVTGDVYAEVCKKDGSERSRQEVRDSKSVTPRSDTTAESKSNTIIGEVTGDIYAAVCKTDNL